MRGKSPAEKKNLRRRIQELKSCIIKPESTTSLPEPVDEPVEETSEIIEAEVEGKPKGKAKFTVKVGFAKTVKLHSLGEYIVDAVTRYLIERCPYFKFRTHNGVLQI